MFSWRWLLVIYNRPLCRLLFSPEHNFSNLQMSLYEANSVKNLVCRLAAALRLKN